MINQSTKYENNVVELCGKVHTTPLFSHEIYGEKFYGFDLLTRRTSGYDDIIKVIVSERLIDITTLESETFVKISGQYRSFNSRQNDNGMKLMLNVFAREIEMLDNEEYSNTIILTGFICKPSVYRKTPLGREIADVLLAVNRPYAKSDYIPCVCWGRNANFAAGIEVSQKVNLVGRIQSRVYQKKLSDNSIEEKVAYEVSVSMISLVEE